MKKANLFRCLLCGRLTLHHCAYCREPICKTCQTFSRGKIYCTLQHRDLDTGIGRLLHRLEQSVK